jgi:mevalonate kinase
LKLIGENAADLEMIIWSVFEKALNEIKIKRIDLTGELTITSHIAFGAGMGASATLAVGIAEFLKKINFLTTDTFSFAKKIEDLFHGESSGVDVAVALYQKPLLYQRGHDIVLLESVKLPRLYLSHCGVRGVTKDCVTKVKKLFQTDPQLAQKLDLKMAESVEMFKEVIRSEDLVAWVKAMNLAQTCFEDWGLVPSEAQSHINHLKAQGALSCKMTGSGGGGYVLSLWRDNPPRQLNDILIKV